jgi:hypothetical protein
MQVILPVFRDEGPLNGHRDAAQHKQSDVGVGQLAHNTTCRGTWVKDTHGRGISIGT